MIHVKQNWNGAEAYATVVAASWEAVTRVANYYHMKLQESVSTSAGRVVQRIFRRMRHGKVARIEIRENPSTPGKPPHLRTGYLRKNIIPDYDKANLTVRVGIVTNAKYGKWLELGTQYMAARPFLLATLRKFLPQLKALARAR